MTDKRTALFDRHVALGARCVAFGGWEMPLQYRSAREEHLAVRGDAGLFDIGHMGVLTLDGPRAFDFLQRALSNDLRKLDQPGKAQYTCLCNDDGGIVDDLLVYRLEAAWMLVVNASRTQADLARLREIAAGEGLDPPDLGLKHRTELGQLALQGPRAYAMLRPLLDRPVDDLASFAAVPVDWNVEGLRVGSGPGLLSRTGYTGEQGFEIILPHEAVVPMWDRLLEAGAAPCGLAARDTLRLEMGYCLYGNEIDEQTTPLQAGLGWVTALDKPGGFVGCESLAQAGGPTLTGLTLDARGVPRKGYAVLHEGRQVGEITSGAHSPSLDVGIALAYLAGDIDPGAPLAVEIRGKAVPARLTPPPFVKPQVPARAPLAADGK